MYTMLDPGSCSWQAVPCSILDPAAGRLVTARLARKLAPAVKSPAAGWDGLGGWMHAWMDARAGNDIRIKNSHRIYRKG